MVIAKKYNEKKTTTTVIGQVIRQFGTAALKEVKKCNSNFIYIP